MRHGEALSIADDQKKGLSEKGKFQVARIAKQARALELKIHHIYSSTKQRAKMSAEIFANVFGVSFQEVEGLGPYDNPDAWLQRVRFEENLLIISHLPFLEFLADKLLQKPLSFSFYESSFLGLVFEEIWKIELYLSNSTL